MACLNDQVFSLTGILQRGLSAETDSKLLHLAKKSSRHDDIALALRNVSEGRVVLTESEQMSRYRINLDFTDR